MYIPKESELTILGIVDEWPSSSRMSCSRSSPSILLSFVPFTRRTSTQPLCAGAPTLAMLPPGPRFPGVQHRTLGRAAITDLSLAFPDRKISTTSHRAPPLLPEIPDKHSEQRGPASPASRSTRLPIFNPHPVLPYHPYLHHPAFSPGWSPYWDTVSHPSPPAPTANHFVDRPTSLPLTLNNLGPDFNTSRSSQMYLSTRMCSSEDPDRPRSASFPLATNLVLGLSPPSPNLRPRHLSADQSLGEYSHIGRIPTNNGPRAISTPESEDDGDSVESRRRKRRRLATELPRNVGLQHALHLNTLLNTWHRKT